MTPEALIRECRRSGVMIDLDGDSLKLVGANEAVKAAADLLRPFKSAIVAYLTDLLSQFRFDLVEMDVAPEELRRVNNICYRLVHVGGWQFDEAMTAAATWVINNPPHNDEKAFIDVLNLWKKSGANSL